MEDVFKIYCKFDTNAEPLTDIMCKSYTDFLHQFKKDEKNLEISRHNNEKRDKMQTINIVMGKGDWCIS